jgi:beta-phosphoglucomutase-like phosphatase (HAD superfamily)
MPCLPGIGLETTDKYTRKYIMQVCGKSYQAMIFDFDGVLADSVEVKTDAFRQMFVAYGKEIQEKVVEHHRHHGGMTRKEKLVYYHKQFLGKNLTPARLSELCDTFSSLVVQKVIAAPQIPGAEAFLTRCRAENILCFVDSATPDDELARIVEQRGLSGYFEKILGSDRTKTRNLAWILETCDLLPSQCLFFGDAGSDREAALACDVDFMGIVPDETAPLLQKYPDISWTNDFNQLMAGECHG